MFPESSNFEEYSNRSGGREWPWQTLGPCKWNLNVFRVDKNYASHLSIVHLDGLNVSRSSRANAGEAE